MALEVLLDDDVVDALDAAPDGCEVDEDIDDDDDDEDGAVVDDDESTPPPAFASFEFTNDNGNG